MTALDQFDRLETLGIWYSHTDEPGKEVVVKFGKSTLVIEESADAPLAHWSLAALERSGENGKAIRFRASDDGEEELEIDDPVMLEALDKVLDPDQFTLTPPSKRYGWWLLVPFVLGLIGLLLLVPAGLGRIAYAMISPEQAQQIGALMLPRLEERTGPICASDAGERALRRIEKRLSTAGPVTLSVLELGDKKLLALPGGHVVLNRDLVETSRNAEELASWAALALAEPAPGAAVRSLFEDGISGDILVFLAKGHVTIAARERAVNRMLIDNTTMPKPDPEKLAQILADADLPSSPLEATLRRDGIELHGALSSNQPVLGDQDWVGLQQICD